MDWSPFLRVLGAAALLAAAPSQLLAATPAVDSSATVDILRALSLQKIEDLEFGGIVVAGAGTAVMDPLSNTMTTTGALTALSGTRNAALFRGAAFGGAVVIIRVPKQPVTLIRVGGTETLVLSKFTLDGPSKRTMAQSPTFEFRVGGTITIPAGPADGDYVGTFEVTAQYP